MDSFIAWVGGKRQMRDLIISKLPVECKRYVEVFGGGGWVLFRQRHAPFEVWNDFDIDLVNLYRAVKYNHDELIIDIETTALNSRVYFDLIRGEFETNLRQESKDILRSLTELERASIFFQLLRMSYSATGKNFACQPINISRWKDPIKSAHQRLYGDGVILENKDCIQLIKHYDRPDTVFFLDPPYVGAESFYKNGNEFGAEKHTQLRDTLLGIQGKFILTYNAHPFVYELYRKDCFTIEEITRLHNMRQRTEAGALYAEYIISNFDTTERARNASTQLTLFEEDNFFEHCGLLLPDNPKIII